MTGNNRTADPTAQVPVPPADDAAAARGRQARRWWQHQRVQLPAVAFLAVLVPMGLVFLTYTTTMNSTIQLSVDPQMRGRVMSLYALILGGVFPIGAFLVGAISEAWGVARAFLVMGSMGLATLATLDPPPESVPT